MIPSIFKSTIGKKVVMASTGALLVGFVFAHLVGNMLIFVGPHALNSYAQMLKDLAEVVWIARIVLLTAIVLHIGSAAALTIENKKARPIPYEATKSIKTTYAARTMMASGFIILSFVVYHLLHFTLRKTNPEISHFVDELGRHDVYSMVVLSFQNIFISGAYIISVALLALHLSHGISSMFQSLGLNNQLFAPKIEMASKAGAAILFIGFASIPIAVLSGFVSLAEGVGH